LKVFLEDNCRKPASIANNTWPVIQRGWQRIGADAVPILEKIIVDVPDAKTKLQPIIDDLKTPPLNPLVK